MCGFFPQTSIYSIAIWISMWLTVVCLWVPCGRIWPPAALSACRNTDRPLVLKCGDSRGSAVRPPSVTCLKEKYQRNKTNSRSIRSNLFSHSIETITKYTADLNYKTMWSKIYKWRVYFRHVTHRVNPNEWSSSHGVEVETLRNQSLIYTCSVLNLLTIVTESLKSFGPLVGESC